MVQNVSTMVQNGPKMVQNGPKWSKMVLNNPNNFPKFPNQNFQDRSGRVGASQGESERLRTVGQDNRAVQNSPECLKNAK